MVERNRLVASSPGRHRLTWVRALLGGGASAALLPWIVRELGGDATTCLRLGALFAIATLSSEVPAALAGDRSGRARPWLARAGVVQALGLAIIAAAPSLFVVAIGVVVVGVGAGLSTGAEGRASLAIGRDARGVARLEVEALLGKGTACCAIAIVAVAFGLGARGAIAVSACGTLLAAALASTLRCADRVQSTRRGRRDPQRAPRAEERRGDRRAFRSIGVIALIVAVASLNLASRGTDSIDALALLHGSGPGTILACAAVFAAKGGIARTLAPLVTRGRLWGVALAAVVSVFLFWSATRATDHFVLLNVAIACGVAGGASAAARGTLLSRIGARRAGIGAAIEATARRVALAIGALALAPLVHGGVSGNTYVGCAMVALIGGLAALAPRVIPSLRRKLRARVEDAPLSA